MKETKRTEITDSQVTEYAALNSVEIGQSAKGEWQIKSIKVYGNDINDMLMQAENAATGMMARLNKFERVGEQS